jgi:hypothetical protein
MKTEATREHPILFSAPMVQAVLRGTNPKTVTRRIVNPQPVYEKNAAWCGGGVLRSPKISLAIDSARMGLFTAGDVAKFGGRFGEGGDRLWVRETWRPSVAHSHGMDACDCGDVTVTYAADGEERFFPDGEIPYEWTMPKAAKTGNVPGIHMPRWASRITLAVVSVRVERLHEITEEEIYAEGVQIPVCENPNGTRTGLIRLTGGKHPPPEFLPRGRAGKYSSAEIARAEFASLWSEINGRESWDANPYVWRIEFRRVEARVNRLLADTINVPTVDRGNVANAGANP